MRTGASQYEEDPTVQTEQVDPLSGDAERGNPSDLLHEAATLMHQRAETATSGICPQWIASAVRHVARNCDIECYHPDSQPHGDAAPTWARYDDAEHIASWTPAVALAVADWLADQAVEVAAHASHHAAGDPLYGTPAEQVARFSSAFAVARAYLGRES